MSIQAFNFDSFHRGFIKALTEKYLPWVIAKKIIGN